MIYKNEIATFYGNVTKFYSVDQRDFQLFSNLKFFNELYTTNDYEFGVDEFYLCKNSKKRELIIYYYVIPYKKKYEISTILLDAMLELIRETLSKQMRVLSTNLPLMFLYYP